MKNFYLDKLTIPFQKMNCQQRGQCSPQDRDCKKNRHNKKLLSKVGISFLLCTFLLSYAQAQEEKSVKVVVDDSTVIDVAKSSRVTDKLKGPISNLIGDLQEEISLTLAEGSSAGIKLKNSRVLRPIGKDGFIVTDQTRINFGVGKNIIERTLKSFGLGIKVEGFASPIVKRFFVSSATESRRENYVEMAGPYNVPALYGDSENLYELASSGVKVDRENLARYHRWLDRFTKNISDFPFSSKKVDEMTVGEGFAFAFEGALSVGPGLNLDLSSLGTPGSIFYNYTKVIRGGRFEIIILKTTPDKVLFSIRQARQVLDKKSYKINYGGQVGLELEILLGTSDKKPFYEKFLPDTLKVLRVSREIENINEKRFNAVYELDMSNSADRNIYDQALSDFDFSLFDVFTIRDIARSSKIIEKYRNANVKLVLEQNLRANVLKDSSTISGLFGIFKGQQSSEREVAIGTSKFDGKVVDTYEGSAGYSGFRRSLLGGKNQESFEVFTYEELTRQRRLNPKDVIVYFKKSVVDSDTKGISELPQYIREFNNFIPLDQQVKVKSSDNSSLGTTQGTMDFFITRQDLVEITRLDSQFVIDTIVEGFRAYLDDTDKARLKATHPFNWKLKGKNLEVMESFAKGYFMLKEAVAKGDIAYAAKAIETMFKEPNYVQNYAKFFRYFILSAKRQPLINIRIYNSKIGLSFESTNFDGKAFIREGNLLTKNIERAFLGRSRYYELSDNIASAGYFPGNRAMLFNFASSFKGYLKIVVREKEKESDIFYDIGEFVLDLRNYRGRDFFIDTLNGKSQVEKKIKELIESSAFEKTFYYSASYDDVVYDSERPL